MLLFKRSADLREHLSSKRIDNAGIGFVPTMGALHPGHLSLIETSRAANDITVASIFVNPTQFNDPGDFEKYPITIEADIRVLERAGCDILFLPSVDEMYPEGLPVSDHYDLGFLETVWEGAFRPGHFQGVCTVVRRLLERAEPGNLYMGQKDYQQCLVIDRLLHLMGWQNKTRLHVCPTLREADGLAMSSRNMRLDRNERQKATTIYKVLNGIKEELQPGNVNKITGQAYDRLVSSGFRPDYIAIADAATLEPVSYWDGRQPLVAIAAAFLNDVRLIDNLVLTSAEG